MFNTTILENIKYGNENATEEEVYYACEVANIQKFIDSTPERLHTRIGNKGVRYNSKYSIVHIIDILTLPRLL